MNKSLANRIDRLMPLGSGRRSKSMFDQSSFITAKVPSLLTLTIDEKMQVGHADFIENIQRTLTGKQASHTGAWLATITANSKVTPSDTSLKPPQRWRWVALDDSWNDGNSRNKYEITRREPPLACKSDSNPNSDAGNRIRLEWR